MFPLGFFYKSRSKCSSKTFVDWFVWGGYNTVKTIGAWCIEIGLLTEFLQEAYNELQVCWSVKDTTTEATRTAHTFRAIL